MAKQVFEKFVRDELSDALVDDAAQLFSRHYGTWSGRGVRVGCSGKELRRLYLPVESTSHVRVTVDERLVGSVLAYRWKYHGKIVCWVTQLVVHKDFRDCGLAVGLLNHLRESDDDIIGIMGSHPAACLAAAKAFASSMHAVSTEFISNNARGIMDLSPIECVKNAVLRSSLFHAGDSSGRISSVFTNFGVDHAEPLEALEWVQRSGHWPLGALYDKDEFLLIMQVRSRRGKRVL